jgi:hypothetical protein
MQMGGMAPIQKFMNGRHFGGMEMAELDGGVRSDLPIGNIVFV